MGLSDETIVGIVALLIMCFPGLCFLLRFIHRRGRAHVNAPRAESTVNPVRSSRQMLPSFSVADGFRRPSPSETVSEAVGGLYEPSLLEGGMVYVAVSMHFRTTKGQS